MGEKDENQKILVIPSFENYAEDRARAVADSAANVILQQTLPDVPKVPAYRFDGEFPQNAIGLLSKIEGRFGVSDDTRVKVHGYEPNPETCLFTSTSKYGLPFNVSDIVTTKPKRLMTK